MDLAPKTLNLDDYLVRAVGGTGVAFHDYVGKRGSEIVSLDTFQHNVDLLNRMGEDVRWIMADDHGAVPYEYRWNGALSLGECHSIAAGRALCHPIDLTPLMGRVDFAIIHHCGDHRRMEVVALFECDQDAVHYRLMRTV